MHSRFLRKDEGLMSEVNFLWLIPGVILLLVATLFLISRPSPKEPIPNKDLAISPLPPSTVPQLIEPPPMLVPEPQDSRPSTIVIGTSSDAPMITIRPLSSLDQLEPMAPLDPESKGTIDRLSPLLQAVPGLLLAQEAAGRQLMEVVVDGTLVAAADGNGLRAFAMGPNGIAEHARLFDTGTLTHAINVTALWHVASVLVAQKHLADISRKLEGIQKGIDGISQFLDNQRRTRITSTYKYLLQIHSALRSGELSQAARGELESCERSLIEVQDHLMVEYEQKASESIQVGRWGTKKACLGVESRLIQLDQVARDIAVCIETRTAAWVILSLYPGNSQQKIARRESIEASISAFEALGPANRSKLESEIASIDSVWNRRKTLEFRRAHLRARCINSTDQLSVLSARAFEQIRQSDQVMLRASSPTRLLAHVEDGAIVAIEPR